MIAYNHSIKFIPDLENTRCESGSFSKSITIKENTSVDLSKKLKYQISFTNNQGRDLTLYTDRAFARTLPEQRWIFDVEGVVTFFWSSGELSIDYLPGKNFTTELLEYWTLHILLPIFLTIEEHYYFLHAGAVEVNDRPILFIAESYGGKSTMTDFFIKQGHKMVSDDKVAILEEKGKFLAIPSHPHHRPYRGMEDLGCFVQNMATTPKPISNIYILQRVTQEAEITIRELQGIEKFQSLSFSSEINLSFLKTQRFKALGRLAESVPVYKLSVPWNLERLEEVYNTIVNHCNVEL